MAHVHHCPAIVEHIAAGTPIEDLRKSLQRIGPVVSLVRNTELFNGCEVHLDSAFATFQLKDALDFSAIPPIHACGSLISVSPPSSFHAAVLLGDTSSLTECDVVAHFSDASFTVSRVCSDSSWFFRLNFASNEARDALVAANARCVINRAVFSLREYPRRERPPCGRWADPQPCYVDGWAGDFVLVHCDREFRIGIHLGVAVSGLLRGLVAEAPALRRLELPAIPGDFQVFHKVFWTIPVTIATEASYDPDFIYLMAAHLEIVHVMRETEADYYQTLSFDKTLAGLKWVRPGAAGFDLHIQYLATHAGELADNAAFLRLPHDILGAVACSQYFNGPAQLFDRIKDRTMRTRAFARMGINDYRSLVSDETVDLNQFRTEFIELIRGARNPSKKDVAVQFAGD
jgi:hypothetical protein